MKDCENFKIVASLFATAAILIALTAKILLELKCFKECCSKALGNVF